MSISNSVETSISALIYQAVAWAGYADNAGASPETNIHWGLNTGDPGDGGTMATSEATYTSYARVNVARTTGGHAVSGGVVSPVAAVNFPEGTGGSGTVTHHTTGKTGGGAAIYLLSGTVTPNIVTGNLITPQLTTASTITFD